MSSKPVSSSDPSTPVENKIFLKDVVRGLSQLNKRLECKYFYDERGSRLFDQICELDEYYLTRTEQQIMDQYANEMAYQIGPDAMLVEFGSGSSTKTRALLDAARQLAVYVPLDISEEHLLKTAIGLKKSYPELEIRPLVADFTKPFTLPKTKRHVSHAAVYFPGSTIGNFTPEQTHQMFERIADILGPNGGMLIGFDLQKDPAIIHAAYNDARGVTDQFNLNVLYRVNRELNANFDVDQFRHKAVYNQQLGRVEIFVVSCCEQTVRIGDHEFQFQPDEEIFTEYSHKYTIESFSQMVVRAGFDVRKYWTDEKDYFAVMHVVNDPSGQAPQS